MHCPLKYIAIASLLGFASAAHGQDYPNSLTSLSLQNASLEVGAGIMCDTPQQVKRYLILAKEMRGAESVDRALDAANTKVNDPKACGAAIIAIVRGAQIETVETDRSTAQVTRVTVVAVATMHGWRQVPAVIQYTAISEPGETI